ncbi:hypothetical protein HFO15_11245 [Rhizobium laguerreae]|uniref:hypothetical protein n=1 Tax=Rhizobium laguerreae TaxID=1076926 RepID=UPI0014423340|nr:hypothetical protein [Rhizobium laguerreae]MBY3262224.1 hypothetical protein [Rhizobium laguerreae]MBY3338740.1 hypothetical protein [Rhizobium laguerreae]NKM16986.1 hypothetical protein [Rhizobium laguerreae]
MIAYLERYGPIISAVIATAFIYYFKSDLIDGAVRKSIGFSNLYSAVFNWSSIQTGFVFGIFGYVAGKSGGFIEAIKNTPEMALFLSYTKRAIYLGFVLTFFCIFLTVMSFDIGSGAAWKFHVFAAFCFFSLWGFLAFLRVAYVFGCILHVKDKARVPG